MNYSKKDGKKFWKLLDKIEQRQDDTIFKKGISGHKWVSHFKSILQGPDRNHTLPKSTTKKGILDDEITEEEIKLSAYILRSGKA